MILSSPAAFFTTLALGGMLLLHPEPCFAYQARVANLTLSSDRPFDAAAGRAVLREALGKLRASPLYDARRPLRVFVCNEPWRERLFFNTSHGAAGVCYARLHEVFLRHALIGRNQLPPARPPRDLAYYVAHECTHDLVGFRPGLPRWVREGLPDYVGRRGTFKYGELLAAYKAGAPEMSPERSGRYDRFMLMVAWCLEQRGMSQPALLRQPPPASEVERALRGTP